MKLGETRMTLHDVEGSKIGVWLEDKVRSCLVCGQLFWSWGAENRSCQPCLGSREHKGLARLIEAQLVPLYSIALDPLWEPETAEAMSQEEKEETFQKLKEEIEEGRLDAEIYPGQVPTFWKIPQADARKLKCPVCGEIVYRPGTADQHSCFVRDQNDLDRVIRDLEGI